MGKIANFFIANQRNNFSPPTLSTKAFIIYGLILLLLRLLLTSIPAGGAAVESNTLMALVNQERANRNLVVLATRPTLQVAAAAKSQDMIDRDYFAHIDPDGNYVWSRIADAGYKPHKILGENLAVDFATSEGMIKAWLDSPTHRANLLHTDFIDQGLSALYGDFQGRYTNLTTSLFGALLTVSPAAKEAPAPPAAVAHQEPPAQPEVEAASPQLEAPQQPEPIKSSPSPTTQPSPLPPLPPAPTAFQISRLVSTVFGIILLMLLTTNSVIIYRHQQATQKTIPFRAHGSYHLFGILLIVLVSVLIWWW